MNVNLYVLIFIPLILLFVNRKNIFFVMSAVFLLLSISGISKVETKKVKFINNDVFLVIDTTYSMLCNDLKPNRLEYAKKKIIEFIEKSNFTIGIASFNNKVNILSLPTTNKSLLIKKVKLLKALKSRTDIKMAINKIKSINPKTKIILVSDGGESKIKGDFIFWGFATKDGAKVPGFNAISRLNIIGDKYFRYNELNKLINYIKNTKNYTQKEVKIYKPLSFMFSVLAFISFVIGIVVNRFNILLVLMFIYPSSLKANDFLGCLYEYIGFKNKAFEEFRKGKSEFAKIKTSLYYVKNNQYKNALNALKNTKSQKSKYLKALILTKLKKYNQAYEIVKNLPLNKQQIKLFTFLKSHKTNQSVIYPLPNNSSKIKQKEHLW